MTAEFTNRIACGMRGLRGFEGQMGSLHWREEGNLIKDPETERSRPGAPGLESSRSKRSGQKRWLRPRVLGP